MSNTSHKSMGPIGIHGAEHQRRESIRYIVGKSSTSRPPHIGVWSTFGGGNPLMIASTVAVDASEDAVAGDVVPCGSGVNKAFLACGGHQRASVIHAVEFASAFALE